MVGWFVGSREVDKLIFDTVDWRDRCHMLDWDVTDFERDRITEMWLDFCGNHSNEIENGMKSVKQHK